MEKPIVLVVMDGVGKGDGGSGDAVVVAKTPTLDNLLATCPHTYLKAHGTAVGLPSDEDMGNSEVATMLSAAARSTLRAQSWLASLSKTAPCLHPVYGRIWLPTLCPARLCTSWACCPTAMFTPIFPT